MEKKNLCVYCSSSDAVDNKYFEYSDLLAEYMIAYHYDLVYGGASVGLMGRMARKIKSCYGKVIGVIPQLIHEKRISFEDADIMFVTKDMHERKAKLAELSDAFLTLPGGFGTLEELSEIITLKQLGYHQKPIVIVNLDGFYDNLLKQYEVFYDEKFAKKVSQKLYFVSSNLDEIFKYLKNYKFEELDNKWFDVSKKAFE